MKISLLLSVLTVLSISAICFGEESASQGDAEEPGFEIPEDKVLLKMKVRELKDILNRKGPKAACLACTSKQEYVERIHQTESWPDVTPSSSPPTYDPNDEKTREELEKIFSNSKDPAYMAELKAKLKAAGIDTNNVFTGDQINPDILKNYKKYDVGGEKDKSDGESDAASDEKEEEQEEPKEDL